LGQPVGQARGYQKSASRPGIIDIKIKLDAGSIFYHILLWYWFKLFWCLLHVILEALLTAMSLKHKTNIIRPSHFNDLSMPMELSIKSKQKYDQL
jgi:hypothetical protein